MKWDNRFLKLAFNISEWSKDPSTKVGCVIVRPETRTILSTGYNGLPRGIKDTVARLSDQDFKYHVTTHAEINAICNAARDGVNINGADLYSTWVPCAGHDHGAFPSCASAIIQAGIKSVIVPVHIIPERWMKSFKMSQQLFKEAGVEYRTIEMKEINNA